MRRGLRNSNNRVKPDRRGADLSVRSRAGAAVSKPVCPGFFFFLRDLLRSVPSKSPRGKQPMKRYRQFALLVLVLTSTFAESYAVDRTVAAGRNKCVSSPRDAAER